MADAELGILGTLLFSFILLFVGISSVDTIISPAFILSGAVGIIASVGAFLGFIK